jgi:serine/threonine protein phosphatase 1
MKKHRRRIVIGDVHGHFDGMMALLEEIAPGDKDEVYFLGDLIDRGPKSAQVVNFVRESPYKCILGNHEHMMLNAMPEGKVDREAWQAWLYSGGRETIESYRDIEVMPYEDLEWIKSLPAYLDLGDVWLVHAGVKPEKPLKEQTINEFCWIRKDFHHIEKPFFKDKLIITGHTITFTFDGVEPGELVRGNGWLDIDTSAYHHKSGWLTGLDIDNKLAYQVNVFDNLKRQVPMEEIVKEYQVPSAAEKQQSLLSRLLSLKL